ncbi:MAG: dihydropteroate synthase [Rhodospirillaceae bacterium]|nr:dihydropteroate synthase [Rhodospirillaceae bacterium]
MTPTVEPLLREPCPALPRGAALLGVEKTFYLAPEGLLSGMAARAAQASDLALPLAGGPFAFTHLRLFRRDPSRGRLAETVAPIAELRSWAAGEGAPVATHAKTLLDRLTGMRPSFAGLTLDRPRIMGIVNVTPDSFSDGGEHMDTQSAVAHGLALLEAGADILDVGGESTRPGSGEMAPEQEAARVVPVIRALAERGAVLSVDTRHAPVMAQAVEAGAAIINDIAALEGDPEALRVAARSKAAIVLMHMRGTPEGMQEDPRYASAALDIYDYLAKRIAACEAGGIVRTRLSVDPGIGFGKTVAHNAELLGQQALFHALGAPILLGVSRKSFIGRLSRGEAPKQRVAGSIAAALAGLERGVQILRVHDVAETAQAVAVWRAIRDAV